MASYEPTPEECCEENEDGLEYRRKFGLEDLWGSFESIYYNVNESMMNDGPNVFLSQGDALLSTLVTPSARVLVKPASPEAVDKAPLVEALDNILLEDLRLEEQVEAACLNAYLFGRGFIKIGYDSGWGYDPSYDVGGNLKMGLTLTQLDRKGQRLIEYNAAVSPGMPWVQSVMPHDIIVGWGVKDISTAPYVTHRVVRHIDDIRADRKYENTKDLEPQLSMQDFVNSYRTANKRQVGKSSAAGTRKVEYVELFERHDRRTGKIYTFTWDHPKFLRNQTNALQIKNQLPFAGLSFIPRARSFWTTPDVFYLYHIQNELSDVARQRTKQRRISVIKFLYDKGAITDGELAKLLSPDVGVAAAVEGGHKLSEAVIKLENQPNTTLVQEEELLRANAREQIGFSRNQLGEYTGGRKTAREVATVDRSSQLRMSRRGLQVKRLYEDVIRLVNEVVFTQWTAPRIIEVMGEEQGSEWVQINGAQLRSRYSYKVEFVDEREAESEAIQALNLYQLLAQDPSVDPVALRQFLTNRVNNPAFTRIFNADVRTAMLQRKLQGGDGGTPPDLNGSQRLAQMSKMQGSNGQARLPSTAGLMARGGNNS